MTNFEKYSDDDLLDLCDANIKEELISRGYEYGWHKRVCYAGEIYILVNPAFPKLVKIGYADNVPKRVKQLNSSAGVPDPYHVYATYKVKKRLEDLKLHKLIDSLDSHLRHTKNKEFYEMSPEKAYAILSAIAEINGDEDLLVINPYQDDYFTEIKPTTSVPEPVVTRDNVVPDGEYYMERLVKAWGQRVKATVRVEGNKWIIKRGSIISPVSSDTGMPPHILKARKDMNTIDNVLQQDVIFSTPSAAARFVSGVSCDGWWDWKLSDGRPVDIYRKKVE